MNRHEKNIRKLSEETYSLRPYKRDVLISEIPPPLHIPSLTTSDSSSWNLRGKDIIEDVANPILFSEEKIREQQRAGNNAKRLPKGQYGYNQRYLLDSTIGDRLILLKQGEQLPPQGEQNALTSIVDKSKISTNAFSNFMLRSKSRAFERDDVGVLSQIHVPTEVQRAKPPLISPDLQNVTVHNEPGKTKHFRIGDYVENRTRVERELNPDSLLSQERQDIHRRQNLSNENVNRIVSLRKKMIAYKTAS